MYCKNHPVTINKCAHCGKEHETNIPNKKFCSPLCRGAYWAKNSHDIYLESKKRYEEKMKDENPFYHKKTFHEIMFKRCKNCGCAFVDRSAKLNVEVCRSCKDEEKRKIACERENKRNAYKAITKDRSRNCKICGVMFSPLYGFGRGGLSVCSDECMRLTRRNERKKYKKTDSYKTSRSINNHLRRIRKKTGLNGEIITERFNRFEIFERDKWICKLCLKKVNKNLKNPHPMSATLDHIIPISHGGLHVKTNVQLAHMICNSKKGNGSVKGEQMLLIG